MFFSLIVPVYNRPAEVRELLDSLAGQTYGDFEVLVVEDGSQDDCKEVASLFNDRLDIRYYFKENSGQGFSRNFGFERAKGDYLVVFDSDCLVPSHYLETVAREVQLHSLDAYGGPDRTHPSFTPLQKAIGYSMTSPLTTGGIRGNRRHYGMFHPRSFNMGISREVFEKTGGYRITRMGEDIEFSIRIIRSGFRTALIPDAWVYHKRRTTLGGFYRQVHFFGRARVNISRFYPDEMHLLHLTPPFFVLFFFSYLSTLFWNPPLFGLITAGGGVAASFIAAHAALKYNSLQVGLLSCITSFIQVFGYGTGLLSEFWKKIRE